MSDLDSRPINKIFRVTISSTKYMKNSNSDVISLDVYNNSPYKIFLSLGRLGFCETNATTSPTKVKAYRINIILQLLGICQSTILDEELSIKNTINTPLYLPLKPDAVFKTQRASKVPIHLQDNVNRILDILQQYETFSPVNKEEQPKRNTFMIPNNILAKGEALKKDLDARIVLNSLIDESKCDWPYETIQVNSQKQTVKILQKQT